MKRNHTTMCLIGIAAALVLIAIAGVNSSTIVFLVFVLACPLMMFFMMKTMMKPNASTISDAEQPSYPPPLNRSMDRRR